MDSPWERWDIGKQATLQSGISGDLYRGYNTKQGMYKYIPVKFLI